MKKNRVKIGILLILLSTIAVLEIFDLHPCIPLGNIDVTWSGFRHMQVLYTHGEMTANGGIVRSSNKCSYCKRYEHFFGPVTIYRYEQPAKKPFAEFENTPLWKAVDAAISDLQKHQFVEVTTARENVIGYICQQLARKQVADKTSFAKD